MSTFTPERLERWTMPRDYFGESWPEYYSAGVGQSRDSDALERANFRAMLQLLGGESETVLVVCESHWAVGWIEWIAIHESDSKSLQLADDARQALDNYPVLNEELYSELEDDDCQLTWANCYNWRERLEYLRKHVGFDGAYWGQREVWRDVLSAVRGDWHSAANLLPCPSDILH
jgi:hypothetical protein